MRSHKQTKTLTLPLLLSFITLALSILSSCGTLIKTPVDISDEPLYYLKGRCDQPNTFSDFAVEMHFLTSGQTDMNIAAWNPISQGMVAMPLSAWDEFNTVIGELCSNWPCNYETTSKLHTLFASLSKASGHSFKYSFQ